MCTGLATPPCENQDAKETSMSPRCRTDKMLTDPAMKMDTRRVVIWGCWNVITLFDTSKVNQNAKEIEANSVIKMGVSEMRWNIRGKRLFCKMK